MSGEASLFEPGCSFVTRHHELAGTRILESWPSVRRSTCKRLPTCNHQSLLRVWFIAFAGQSLFFSLVSSSPSLLRPESCESLENVIVHLCSRLALQSEIPSLRLCSRNCKYLALHTEQFQITFLDFIG